MARSAFAVLLSAGGVFADPLYELRGSVTPATPEVTLNAVDLAKLEEAVSDRKGVLRHCFEKEMSNEPPIADGKVSVRFTITTAGRTANITIEENTTGSKPLAKCVQDSVGTWHLFKPQKEVRVLYPFQFKAVQGAPRRADQ